MPASPTPSSDEIPAAVAAFRSALEEHRFELLDLALADDVRRIALWRDGPDTIVGKSAYVEYLSSRPAAFHRWALRFVDVGVDRTGERVFAHVHEDLQRTTRSPLLFIDQLFAITLDRQGRIAEIDLYFKVDPPFARSVVERHG